MKPMILTDIEKLAYEKIEISISEVNDHLRIENQLYAFLCLVNQRIQLVISTSNTCKYNYLRDIMISIEKDFFIVHFGDVKRVLEINGINAKSIVEFSKVYFPIFKPQIL